jgi:hypothetical protein
MKNAKNAKKQSAKPAEPESKQKAAWTPERRAAQAERMKGNRHGSFPKKAKAGKEASVLGVLTFLRHAAGETMKDIREGEVTLKNLRRKDVLVLLAFVDTRDQ